MLSIHGLGVGSLRAPQSRAREEASLVDVAEAVTVAGVKGVAGVAGVVTVETSTSSTVSQVVAAEGPGTISPSELPERLPKWLPFSMRLAASKLSTGLLGSVRVRVRVNRRFQEPRFGLRLTSRVARVVSSILRR